MTNRLLSILSLSLALLTLPGCGVEEGTGPVDPQAATGFWFGFTDPERSGTSPSIREEQDTLEILLQEDEQGRITGSGTIRGRGEGQAFVIEGTSQFPLVFLTLFGGQPRSGAAQLVNLRAEFTGERLLSGRLTGDRFANVRVRLQRQSPRTGL